MALAIGLDVGGTNTKAILLEQDGNILAQTATSTTSALGVSGVTNCIIDVIGQILANSGRALHELEGIGVAFAGGITDEGVVEWTVHVGEGWPGYDLGAKLSAIFPTRFHYALDVHAAALGEGYFGAARGVKSYAIITVGTGIGAGIVDNGRVFTGGLGTAGGIGHTVVDVNNMRRCACGNWGCLETLVAAGALIEKASELLRSGTETEIRTLCGGKADRITPHMIFEAAQMGDKAAAAIFREAGRCFGVALLNFADILAPEMIVVGGGIAEAGDLFLNPAREQVRKRGWPPIVRQISIVPAKLGGLSGAFGAAAMIFNNIRIRA